ncbi:MAG: hypothetical protein QXX95_06215 [Nitrososphaerales archaeon]
MVEASLGKRVLGLALLALALFLILNVAQSFTSLKVLNEEWVKEVRESLFTFGKGEDKSPFLIVRTLLVQPEPFLVSPLADIPVSLTSKDAKENATIFGKTGSRGNIIFRVPAGEYVISAKYLGIIGNITLTLPNERAWVLVTYKYNRQPLDFFSFEFTDKDDTGIIYAGDAVKIKFYSEVIETPELLELYIPIGSARRSEELKQTYVTIINFKVMNSLNSDGEYKLTLTSYEPLPLNKLPYHSVKAAVYWLKIEVNRG